MLEMEDGFGRREGRSMRLTLHNVGKIKDASIDFNGITVIAGENNTGKSTVGKMLFCIFSSFYRLEEQMKEERIQTVARTIENYYPVNRHRYISGFDSCTLTREIMEKREKFMKNPLALMKELETCMLEADPDIGKELDEESLRSLVDRIIEFLRIEDDEIAVAVLRKRLDAEFGMNIGYLNDLDDDAHICLHIKNRQIEFFVKKNKDIQILKKMNLVKDIIYIDDPFVLDILSNRFVLTLMGSEDHRSSLMDKLQENSSKNGFSTINELVVQKKLNKIIDIMSDVCDGELIPSGIGKSVYTYKTDKLDHTLEMSNLSTGMKSFVILRTLLMNGSIDENGVVILDEPEIHLHPEWQLKFAEIIVLIQKEFGTNILLNTHSPYFLNAIQVYSEKYGIEDKCKYYLTQEQERRVEIQDVTNELELIYKKLARPLQDLENMRY